MEQICKFCEKGIQYEKGRQFSAHVRNCKQNPQLANIHRKLGKKLKKRYRFVCKCGREYSLLITPHRFNINKYRKHCSWKCSNTKQHTQETRDKISQNLKGRRVGAAEYSYMGYEDRSCIVCQVAFKIRKWSKRRTCGNRECTKEIFRINSKGKVGGYRPNATKNYKSGMYRGIWMDSSWEIKLAKILDEKKIVWEKSTKHKFIYYDKQNVKRRYYPDFYLPEYNIYVEVKGFWTEESKYKVNDVIRRHNIRLLILESEKEIEDIPNRLSNIGVEELGSLARLMTLSM